MDGTGRNMVGLTTEEAREQLAGTQIVGCGCLIILAALLGAALLATAVAVDRAFDKEVAAYSICEMCGAVLDATNVHAVCAETVEPEYAAVKLVDWETLRKVEDEIFKPLLTHVTLKLDNGRELHIAGGIVIEEVANAH